MYLHVDTPGIGIDNFFGQYFEMKCEMLRLPTAIQFIAYSHRCEMTKELENVIPVPGKCNPLNSCKLFLYFFIQTTRYSVEILTINFD